MNKYITKEWIFEFAKLMLERYKDNTYGALSEDQTHPILSYNQRSYFKTMRLYVGYTLDKIYKTKE